MREEGLHWVHAALNAISTHRPRERLTLHHGATLPIDELIPHGRLRLPNT